MAISLKEEKLIPLPPFSPNSSPVSFRRTLLYFMLPLLTFDTIPLMKLVVQRVKEASVKTVKNNKVVGKIGKGYFVLVGVKKGDSLDDAENLANKLLKLRVMSDENDKMNLSIKDAGGEILIVSQFTLYADTSGGNRPSFINAALPEDAEKIYEYFVNKLKEGGIKVETGSFGDYMEIDAILDGPVTIVFER